MPYEVTWEPGASDFIDVRLFGNVTRSEYDECNARVREAQDAGCRGGLFDVSALDNLVDTLGFVLAGGYRSWGQPGFRRVLVTPRSGAAPIRIGLDTLRAARLPITVVSTRDEAVAFLQSESR